MDIKQKTLYEQAEEKVRNSPILAPHADFIMYDWNEGDEHWKWVLRATNEEILNWVPDNE